MATLSAEDQALLDAFKELKSKTAVPKVETTEDLTSFIKHYGAELIAASTPPAAPTMPSASVTNMPRISIFFGETGKGEVNYPAWKYELKCLLAERSYTEEQILLGIRRSCRGNAADKLRRLGITPTIPGIIERFDADFGSIDSKETILKKFYNCHKEEGESLEAYASRLEEIFAQALEMEAVKPSEKDSLRRVLYSGLPLSLKQIASYAFATEKDYDKFKLQLRTLENELLVSKETESSTTTKTKCNVTTKKEEDPQIKEMLGLMQQMNERIKKLETQNETEYQYKPFIPRGRGSRGNNTGYRQRGQGPFVGQGRGRGSYTPARPLASTSFQPRGCYSCGGTDHIARNCPSNNQRFEPRCCFNCGKPDHIARNCPDKQGN